MMQNRPKSSTLLRRRWIGIVQDEVELMKGKVQSMEGKVDKIEGKVDKIEKSMQNIEDILSKLMTTGVAAG